ncbi:S9 family peptidase [Undibacterium sp. YM2]|uniref:alpha/beta hydrolase family protein n=1 Tax=Undibacterium sp. YM2 TaxID=2058625 RepID=UPI00138A47E0|nr:alpha/beta fold hydrolase [Undibacterium sp. YM2]
MRTIYLRITQPVLKLMLALTWVLVNAQAIQARETPIPVENFFKSAQFTDALLSPNAEFIAFLAADTSNRTMLLVMNAQGDATPTVVARYSNLDVVFFNWVNNDRLVYGISDKKTGAGDTYAGTGLFAIDKDGKNSRQIIDRIRSIEAPKFRMLPASTQFISPVNSENSDDVYVGQPSTERVNSGINLFRVNTRTGQAEIVSVPPNSGSFLQDQSGQIRIAVSNRDGITGVHYKENKNTPWVLLNKFDGTIEDGYVPIFISSEGELYVTARNGKDTAALYRYDIKKKALDASPLMELNGFDFEGRILFNSKQNKIAGIRYESDAPGTLWLDEKEKRIQGQIDALLPDRVNNVDIGRNPDSDIRLVKSFSDTHPGSFLLFNAATSKLTPLGEVLPDIDTSKMAYRDFVRYKARDGMEIPAYVTLPKGRPAKNLPLVVMVHGGPYLRGGHWNWTPAVQFLASRGYAVIEPDFRGSTGYGKKLHEAGWKQWGLAMQDDLADAREWAIKQGYADPKRVCIAGASYGGYAVLMGLIKEPDLYRCGISWVGVSDINLLYDVSWSDTAGNAWTKFGMPKLIGDQQKDAEQLQRTSPLQQASRLKSPLILAYGGADVRVPIIHGTKFYDAVKAHNKKVEWIVYPEEAHVWGLLKNNVDFWTRVEKFLDENTAVK